MMQSASSGDLIHGEKGELLQLHVLLLQLLLESGGELLLAVALQQVDPGLVLVHHIVDG